MTKAEQAQQEHHERLMDCGRAMDALAAKHRDQTGRTPSRWQPAYEPPQVELAKAA